LDKKGGYFSLLTQLFISVRASDVGIRDLDHYFGGWMRDGSTTDHGSDYLPNNEKKTSTLA